MPLLFLLTLVTIPLLAALNWRTSFEEPRFVFTLYASFPIVFAFAVSRLLRGPAVCRVLALGLLGLALFASVRGLLREPQHPECAPSDPLNGSLADLIRELDTRHLKSVHASYWVAYRLAFETDERIVATPFGESNRLRVERYREAVNRDDCPAFVLSGGEAEEFRRYLQRRHAAFRTFAVGPLHVFHDLDPQVLAQLRKAADFPRGP